MEKIRPAAGSILTGFLLFFGPQILADLPLVFLERASGRELPAAGIFLTAAAAFAAFFFYKHHFRPAFQGNLLGNLKEGLHLGLPVLLYWAGSLLLALLTGHFAFKGVTPVIVRVSVSAGVLEELAWRLGVLATLLRRWDTKEQIVPAVIFSAAVFGLIHAFNALAGADPLYTALQVAETACIGVFLGAVYVRSGSLASCMLIHILHDVFAISISPEVEAGGLVTGSVTWLSLADLSMCILLAAAGLSYLGLKHRDRIISLWDRIWSRKDPGESAELPEPGGMRAGLL